MSDPALDLKALCDRARVTPRTVHFYVQQGLLPPASAPGPGARYGEGHVTRLRLIRLLKKQHLPLVEIARRLKGLTDAQAEALVAEAKERRARAGGTALDYIRGILSDPAPRTSIAASRSQVTPLMSAAIDRTEPPERGRSQWDRFTLAEGIELHVRRPLEREQRRKLERLILASREIFEEDPI